MGISQFTVNVLSVVVITLFHLIALHAALRLAGGRIPQSVRRVLPWGIPSAILLLDGPLFVMQVLYKTWHPEIVDQVWSAIWFPWLALQFNAGIAGLLVMFRYGSLWIRSNLNRMSMKKNTLRKKTARIMDSERRERRHDRRELAFEESVGEGIVNGTMPRRHFVRTAALLVGGVAANASFLSAAADDDDMVVERVKIHVPGLPENFRGLRIGMISDLHSNQFMTRERLTLFADALRKLDADLIVLPGDFVNSRVREVYPFAEAFADLNAPLGVFGVTGNHDYYSRDIDIVVREIEQAGIRMLVNENVILKRGDQTLRLLGVDEDAIYDVNEYLKQGETSRGAIENLVSGVDRSETSILLCHKPYPFEEYADLGVNLMLSGHTHGGQIVLAGSDRMNVSFASLASTYLAGLYRSRMHEGAQMYISRGIGWTGIPVRLNCPPEVTHIMLV